MPKIAAKANGTADAPQKPQADKEKKAAIPEKAVTYTIEELIEASENALHVPRECAAAAFKFQKSEMLSLSEAKSIVEKFMKRKVE